jgi:hypothetical protein
MPIGQTRSFTINSEGEADYCLKELFKIPGYRSMDVVNMNAQAYIANPRINMICATQTSGRRPSPKVINHGPSAYGVVWVWLLC